MHHQTTLFHHFLPANSHFGGCLLVVDQQAVLGAGELVAAVAAAERERAASPDEVPLGEWEAQRLRPDLAAPLTSQAPAPQPQDEGGQRGTLRRLVLTGGALLERRPETYEVAERRPLGALAAAVRFMDEPTWLGLEWSDGAPASTYVTPARDALLVAILDAAQVCAPAS
jgi:DnaJ family protein C protein 13